MDLEEVKAEYEKPLETEENPVQKGEKRENIINVLEI